MSIQDLQKMDLPSIRNLFIEEASKYFALADREPPEALKMLRERIKLIETVLDEKKRQTTNDKNLDLA